MKPHIPAYTNFLERFSFSMTVALIILLNPVHAIIMRKITYTIVLAIKSSWKNNLYIIPVKATIVVIKLIRSYKKLFTIFSVIGFTFFVIGFVFSAISDTNSKNE